MKAGPYSIGSDTWPGLSKLMEECGEVVQVIGKIIATGGKEDHWDGTNLRTRLLEEIADLSAAIEFVLFTCGLSTLQYATRSYEKLSLFRKWHQEQS